MNTNQIIITGGSGFIGSNLIKALNNYNVISLNSVKDIATVDLSDIEVNHIFHLAAKTYIPDSLDNSMEFYRVNVMGTINVLEYCRKKKASLTYLSTYIYGDPKYLPVDEKHPQKPHSVYNHSKYLGEDACKFYADYFGLDITILRLFNVYGPGQRKDFLIPFIIAQALNSDEIIVKDLFPKRDYVYIDDVIDAMVRTIRLTGLNIFNVGSGVSISVLEVCKTVLDLLELDKPIRSKNETRPQEVSNVVADASLINKSIGWHPKISFKDGIRKTVDAYKLGD